MTRLTSVDKFPPNLIGRDEQIGRALRDRVRPLREFPAGMRSAFAIALHMHQPLIPAGTGDLQTAPIISNLQYMFEHPEIKDAHNASAFLSCYQRMAEFIPRLIQEGHSPRVMLDYSGCLLHGLEIMGATQAIEALRTLTAPPLDAYVEWLGTAWGHAVAPSTPPQDFRLHVRAWQHQFAAMFGMEALSRVRGFSPPEMALPNHPDVAYEFVKTLLDCGYEWVLVQEHTVETTDAGRTPSTPHLPHRLVVRNSSGESLSIIAIIKTQGSDTKLIGQMQPFYEAKNLQRTKLGDEDVPPLVTQISDGENGGVMMNEFPSAYMQATAAASASDTKAMNVSEYLDCLHAMGVTAESFPTIQPAGQRRIWEAFGEPSGREALEATLAKLRDEDSRFHVDGGSWTANLSWVQGYEGVLGPMAEASQRFAKKFDLNSNVIHTEQFQRALFYLLLSQTSCFRYWGEGEWTDYGKELCRRAMVAMDG